jgi:Leucine-rich repeat (LRR) protein
VELQFNHLQEFSLSSFENCTRFPQHPLTLNLSHNALRHFTPASAHAASLGLAGVAPVGVSGHASYRGGPPFVAELDLSFNELRHVPTASLETISPSLRVLDLGHNALAEIGKAAFRQLAILQVRACRMAAGDMLS